MANVEFQAKRLKFSLGKSLRGSLFAQLQEANDRMRNLLESTDQIAAARKSRGTEMASSLANWKVNEYWRHAKRLHGALSKAWQCDCANHVANLQLQDATSDKIEFGVLFDMGASLGTQCWRETRIETMPDIEQSPPTPTDQHAKYASQAPKIKFVHREIHIR